MYSDITDLQKLLSPNVLAQLADDGRGAEATPEEVMAEAIDQADREIDAFWGAVMEVPLADPAPGLVSNLSAKIAVHNLYRRRPHLEAGEWGDEYKRCCRLLERINRGEISIGAVGGGTAEAMNAGNTVVVTGMPYFGLEAR